MPVPITDLNNLIDKMDEAADAILGTILKNTTILSYAVERRMADYNAQSSAAARRFLQSNNQE
jgi:hypothetical protein